MTNILFQSIGIFLAGCFLFTFMAMMEYSVASYLERRKVTRRILRQMSSKNHEDYAEEENTLGRLRPATIDAYSRVIFPAAFLTFFVVYWIILLCSLENLSDDVIAIQRN